MEKYYIKSIRKIYMYYWKFIEPDTWARLGSAQWNWGSAQLRKKSQNLGSARPGSRAEPSRAFRLVQTSIVKQ